MNEINQYYKILDLDPNASLGEVNKSYRDLVQVWHPDRFNNNQRLRKKANKKLFAINEAYKIISLQFSQKTQIIRKKTEEPGGAAYKEHLRKENQGKYYEDSGQKKYHKSQLKSTKQQLNTIYNYKLLAAFFSFVLGAILSIIYSTYSYNDKIMNKPPSITTFFGEQKLQEQLKEEYQMDRAEYLE
jgi:curved DNA-binding protein CbpA